MRRITLAAFVVMSIVCGLPAAHAAETSSGADTIEPPQLHATAPNASLVTSVSQPPSGKAESPQQRAVGLIAGEAQRARNIGDADKVKEGAVTRLHPAPPPPQGPTRLKQKI